MSAAYFSWGRWLELRQKMKVCVVGPLRSIQIQIYYCSCVRTTHWLTQMPVCDIFLGGWRITGWPNLNR